MLFLLLDVEYRKQMKMPCVSAKQCYATIVGYILPPCSPFSDFAVAGNSDQYELFNPDSMRILMKPIVL
jgi:hypothetical protein